MAKTMASDIKDSVTAACERVADTFADIFYVMIFCTDVFQIFRLPDMASEINYENIEKHGLEIRLFHANGEIRWFRSSVAEEEFYCRECMEDGNLAENVDYWDEEQFLDIDTKKSDTKSQDVVTTGGGRYKLPIIGSKCVNTDVKLIIRNYLGYEFDTGRAYIKDWRILGFAKEGLKDE